MTDYRDTVFLPKTDFPMKAGLAAKEPAMLAKWRADDLYGKLRAARKGRERFILHDGPPYANGDIHMGHVLNKVLKDIIVRSQSLLGKDAPYVPGWDCHGLPIEWKVEEQYRAKKLNKDEVDPVQFRAECRAYAAKWVDVQRAQFERLGVMGDWDDPYLTMKFDAEAAIVGELLKFAETGQLYRGAKPVMWSPVEKTALAEAEVEYEDITSTQIDVAFEITESPIPELVGAHAVIWTTTPWTIPVNQALAYGPEVEYLLVRFDGIVEGPHTLLVARELIDAFGTRIGHPVVIKVGDVGGTVTALKSIKGADLAGTVARHPMHHLGGFFARPRPMLPGDFVTTDAGTGLVHMAPDHGEDDFLLCKAHGIDPVFAVEGDGKYRADWPWLGGQGSVINPKFNAPDGPICADLRETGSLLAASADYRHSYPHSWRSKAKLIFRATPQWFIPMDRAAALPSPSGEGPGGGRLASDSELAGTPHPNPSPEGEGLTLSNDPTLRQIALDAIERTRWVPEKSKNRIEAMVAGRPDWVISRQRAWGVPITLYVNRQTGDYLRDPEVNARIVAATKLGGADAWFAADHQALLGPAYDAADYEPVRDILDVWFDSGSTHAFTIEARYGEGVRADLYVEGSDQHRGWFQSSLLESCGTRGRAPYDAVLTHGFALDGQGRKMSKSVGNVIDPLKVMETSGADILRLWVASTDYFDDVRISQEVLATASDGYRKLRNTFRYLLGALDGFDETERVAVEQMPELERYMLHLLGQLDAELRDATAAFDFGRYARALTDFCNNDLSAFFFDIRKDSLYCDVGPALPGGTEKRRAYRTVLDTLFHALVRYAAPILCFTAEEVWLTRFPDAESVHLLEWPDLAALLTSTHRHPREGGDPSATSDMPATAGALSGLDSRLRGNDELIGKWTKLRQIRSRVTNAIEPLRRDKTLGSSLEASVLLGLEENDQTLVSSVPFDEICIVADLELTEPDAAYAEPTVSKSARYKCGRCWRHLPDVPEDGALDQRCREMVNG